MILVTSRAYLGDTGDHVLDKRLDGSETSNVLSGTVEDGEGDLRTGGSLDLGLVEFWKMYLRANFGETARQARHYMLE